MKSKVSVISTASIALGLFLYVGLAAVPSVAAVSPGGQINFFNVTGTGASSVCTSTAWSGGTFMDGNQGFGGNLGSAQQIPIVANGQEICIEIVFTDQSAITSYTISDPSGILTLVSGTNPFNTDGFGNADVFLIFSVSGLSGDCTTHPIDVSPGISGGEGSSGQIHHIYGGSGACGGTSTTTSTSSSSSTITHGVPEFPAGLAVLLAFLVPALLALKRRSSIPV